MFASQVLTYILAEAATASLLAGGGFIAKSVWDMKVMLAQHTVATDLLLKNHDAKLLDHDERIALLEKS